MNNLNEIQMSVAILAGVILIAIALVIIVVQRTKPKEKPYSEKRSTDAISDKRLTNPTAINPFMSEENFMKKSNGYYRIKQHPSGEWVVSLMGGNHKTVTHGRGYNNLQNAKGSIEAIRRLADTDDIRVERVDSEPDE